MKDGPRVAAAVGEGAQVVATLHKVLGDFQAKKVEMSEHRLRKQMDDLMRIATDQIQNEVKGD